MGAAKTEALNQEATDELRMAELVRFTSRTLETTRPVPFGALIVDTATGKTLMRAVNAVRMENDPSSHAELRTVRKAARKLKSPSLKGYTMYTTCEPCPMCMANALWAGLDRVVYGATIADANKHCKQIRVPAREVARRSDMVCVVNGPVLRKACYDLFTHPNMLKVFASWNPKPEASGSDKTRTRSANR
jgi:tRNA(Arg) A34 adenosine deaminase TadA